MIMDHHFEHHGLFSHIQELNLIWAITKPQFA